jgi:hypothetical protein
VVTNSKRPISRTEDIAGLKIRTIALGANAVPMAFAEASALEPVRKLGGSRSGDVERVSWWA